MERQSDACHGAALTLMAALLVGCSSGVQPKARDDTGSSLKALVSMFTQATTRLGHRPANEAEFKEFVAQNESTLLEAYKIPNADSLFLSTRDNQPFVVVYGRPPADMAAGVVAYEQTGVDGKRQVGFELGYIEEVDDAKFREMVPHPPGG